MSATVALLSNSAEVTATLKSRTMLQGRRCFADRSKDAAASQVVYREDRTTCADILNAIEDTGFEANLKMNEPLQSRQMTVRRAVKIRSTVHIFRCSLACTEWLLRRYSAYAAIVCTNLSDVRNVTSIGLIARHFGSEQRVALADH